MQVCQAPLHSNEDTRMPAWLEHTPCVLRGRRHPLGPAVHENFPSTNACTSSSMDISTDNREAKHATRKLGVNFHACTKWFNHAKVHKGVHEISITPPKFAYITRTNFPLKWKCKSHKDCTMPHTGCQHVYQSTLHTMRTHTVCCH